MELICLTYLISIYFLAYASSYEIGEGGKEKNPSYKIQPAYIPKEKKKLLLKEFSFVSSWLNQVFL